MDTYPNTFAFVQIHHGDAFQTPWGVARGSFYDFGGYPTSYFDGVIERAGAWPYSTYQSDYLLRRAFPTDVTIELSGDAIGGQTYEIHAEVCVEPTGAGKTMRVYTVQVLDRWPASISYSRNGFKQAASTEDITLAAGECQEVVRDFTFDADSWADQGNIKIIAWTQEPQDSSPPSNRAEVFQAAIMTWPFPPSVPIPGDFDNDGDVDGDDFDAFEQCFTGPGGGPLPDECTPGDFDGDDDIDCEDWAEFEVAWTEPGEPPILQPCFAECGNGEVEYGEICDTGIAPGEPGACPTECDSGDPCITGTLLEPGTCVAECAYTPVTVPANDDGCCPEAANAYNDNDCDPACGNGVCEAGEQTSCLPDCECTDDSECIDNYACTFDRCVDQMCSHTPRIYGDVNGDGTPNVFDIFCQLDVLAGTDPLPEGCDALNADIEPCDGNGTINVFDMFEVLYSIAGTNTCNCSEGPP